MTIKGMSVSVLRDASGVDCTMRGVSSRVSRILVVDPTVPALGVFEAKEGDTVLLVDQRGGKDHSYMTPIAVPATVVNGQLVKSPKWHMFGGNYVTSSDSRFSAAYGHVLPVHDRVEG
jgi:hypothetical protein